MFILTNIGYCLIEKRESMSDYASMYLHLFNAVTDALTALDGGDSLYAVVCLRKAQQECEEMYLSASEEADAENESL